jgi:hypothetical protein
MIRNPVARHINTFNKPSVVLSKRRSLQSEATLRDAREDALNELVDSKTITFVSGSTICWDESEDSLQGCLNDIGSSSISIDDTEED